MLVKPFLRKLSQLRASLMQRKKYTNCLQTVSQFTAVCTILCLCLTNEDQLVAFGFARKTVFSKITTKYSNLPMNSFATMFPEWYPMHLMTQSVIAHSVYFGRAYPRIRFVFIQHAFSALYMRIISWRWTNGQLMLMFWEFLLSWYTRYPGFAVHFVVLPFK